jgi:hypothetical protein
MSNRELLPCPFCGKDATLREDSWSSTAWLGGCIDPGCPGDDIVWGHTRDEAVATWNTRAESTTEIILRERLKRADAVIDLVGKVLLRDKTQSRIETAPQSEE